MKLSLDGPNAVVSHPGYTPIDWHVKAFERNRQKNNNLGYEEELEPADPFDQLNLYWESLPNDKQAKIFNVYGNIFEAFENSTGLEDLIYALRPLIQDLFDLHPTSEVTYWIKMKSNIRIPSQVKVYATMEENIKAAEKFGSREWPRESTYLKDDYWGLITLIMTLRTLYPVWGYFMGRVKDDYGNDMKEFWAFKLLIKSSVESSDAFKRLAAYVKHYIPMEKIEKAAVAGYVSTEDFVQWMMGLVVVRRLSLVNYTGRNDKFSLVSSIWSFIDQTMKGYERAVNETIKDKNPEGGTRDNDKDNKSSNLELIKIKETITAGDVVALNEYCVDTEKVALMLCPDLPPALLRQAAEATERLRTQIIRDAQITLLQWVVSKEVPGDPKHAGGTELEMECVFPPRGVDHLEKEQLLSLMTAVCATLWHRKHYDLAALLTAKVQDDRDVAQAGSVEQPAPMSKDLKEKLIELFPHVPRPSGRQQQSESQRPTKKTCEAIESIELLRESFTEHNWVLTLPRPWLDVIPNHRGGRRFAVRADIRNKIADLAIALAERSF